MLEWQPAGIRRVLVRMTEPSFSIVLRVKAGENSKLWLGRFRYDIGGESYLVSDTETQKQWNPSPGRYLKLGWGRAVVYITSGVSNSFISNRKLDQNS